MKLQFCDVETKKKTQPIEVGITRSVRDLVRIPSSKPISLPTTISPVAQGRTSSSPSLARDIRTIDFTFIVLYAAILSLILTCHDLFSTYCVTNPVIVFLVSFGLGSASHAYTGFLREWLHTFTNTTRKIGSSS